MPAQSLETALYETEVHDGFLVHRAGSTSDSIAFIARIHLLLKSGTTHAASRGWAGPSQSEERLFSRFAASYSKRATAMKTLQELFAHMLTQVQSCGAARAATIADLYGTPALLAHEYFGAHAENADAEMHRRMNLLADLKPEGQFMKLGPTLSGTMARLYCSRSYRDEAFWKTW